MQSVSAQSHRQAMLRHIEANDPYSFLNMVDPYLTVCNADDEVRLAAVREYLRLRLVEPARNLLSGFGPFSPHAAELDGISRALQNVHGGSVAWSTRSNQFESNLSNLAQRGVNVDAFRSAWQRQADRFHLFVDANGSEQVLFHDPAGVRRWIPYFGIHARVEESRAFPDGLGSNMPMPVCFDGVGLGHFFERIFNKTRNTFLGYSCALQIIEPEPALLALVLHLRDWRSILADPRVMLFFGNDWSSQLRAAFDVNRDLPFPQHVLGLSPFRGGTHQPPVEVIREIHAERKRTTSEHWSAVSNLYRGCDRSYWARRFAEATSGGPPLRILAAVSRHTTFLQHSMRDAKRAFESLGCRFELLIERTDFDIISPESFHRAIRDLEPDLFFNIDHLRPEFSGIIPDGLPVFTWDQDQLPHVFTRANIDRLTELDFLAGTTKSGFVNLGGKPEQFYFCHMPTSPEQFDGPPLTDEEVARYSCDVSYVSHASQTPSQFHDDERRQFDDPTARKVLDAMFEVMPSMLQQHRVADGWVITRILDDACNRVGVRITNQALMDRLRWWYLWRLGDRLFRHEALEWIAAWSRSTSRRLRIYGNGWERHPTLAEFAAGPAQNGRELLCIHRASRINLQLMPAGFIHQRAMDGLASGGFFLTRLVPHDVRGEALRALATRIQSLNITDPQQLRSSQDKEIALHANEFFGPCWREFLADDRELFRSWLHGAEIPTAVDVFPNFRETTFDAPEEFAARADRFLQDNAARQSIATDMRNVVLSRFTYRNLMSKFVEFINGRLRASQPENC